MQFVALFHQDWVFGLCKAHKEVHQNCKRRSVWETIKERVQNVQMLVFVVVNTLSYTYLVTIVDKSPWNTYVM